MNRLLLGLMPLILWPVLPAWVVLAICATFAVSAQREGWEYMRLPVALLIALAMYLPTMAIQLRTGWVVNIMPTLLLLALACLAIWLVCKAADEATERGGKPWLYLLPLALLAPHPLALVSLGAAALLRPNFDVDVFHPKRLWQTVSVSLVVLGVVLLAFALPHASLLRTAQAGLWQQAAEINDEFIYKDLSRCTKEDLAGGVWSFKDGRWKHSSGCEETGLVFQDEVGESDSFNLLGGFAKHVDRRLFALLALPLLAYAYWRYRKAQVPKPTNEAAPLIPETQAIVPAPTQGTPLHRVRHAYARVEAHLAAAGWSRRESETPAEFLARVGREWPAVASALAQLAAAYAPVRYGGGAGERGAAEAEAVAEQVLAAQPPRAAGGVYSFNTE